jgi:hypothetical protein
VCGKDRSYVELLNRVNNVGMLKASFTQRIVNERGHAIKGTAIHFTLTMALATAMRLFGDVRQVKIHRKSSHKLACGRQIQLLEFYHGRREVLITCPSHVFEGL